MRNIENSIVVVELPRLQSFAGKLVKDRPDIEVNDIIHEAYILLYDRGLNFCFDNMRQPMYDAFRSLKNHVSLSADLSNGVKKGVISPLLKDLECKHCKLCSTVLPVSFFHKAKINQNGVITYQSVCKQCQNKRNLENKRKRFASIEVYESFYEKRRSEQRAKRELIKSNPKLYEYFKNKQKIESRIRRGSKLCASV